MCVIINVETFSLSGHLFNICGMSLQCEYIRVFRSVCYDSLVTSGADFLCTGSEKDRSDLAEIHC